MGLVLESLHKLHLNNFLTSSLRDHHVYEDISNEVIAADTSTSVSIWKVFFYSVSRIRPKGAVMESIGIVLVSRTTRSSVWHTRKQCHML